MLDWEYKLFVKDLFAMSVSEDTAKEISGVNISEALAFVNQNNYFNSRFSHCMNVFEGFGKCSFVSTVVFFRADPPKPLIKDSWKQCVFREKAYSCLSDSTAEVGVELLEKCLRSAKAWINIRGIEIFSISHDVEVYKDIGSVATMASVIVFYQQT